MAGTLFTGEKESLKEGPVHDLRFRASFTRFHHEGAPSLLSFAFSRSCSSAPLAHILCPFPPVLRLSFPTLCVLGLLAQVALWSLALNRKSETRSLTGRLTGICRHLLLGPNRTCLGHLPEHSLAPDPSSTTKDHNRHKPTACLQTKAGCIFVCFCVFCVSSQFMCHIMNCCTDVMNI